MLLSVFGNAAPHQSTISRWYGEFKRGRVRLSDDSRAGAPRTAVTQENVDGVHKLIIEGRHVTYREIEASLKISKASIQKILHEELGQPVTKVIRSRSVSKKMQRTVTADWYTTMCLPKVITKLRKINPERRIILHQDNASSHTSQKARQKTPDLSPNDLDLPANKWNKCFENYEFLKHFRAIIYYNFQRQLLQEECLAELLSVFDNEAPHQSTISRWYEEFKRGRVSLNDDPRVGAPKTAVTQENVDAVRKLIIEDRHQPGLIGVKKTLDRFNSGNSKNVYSILSGDESWIYCYEPENKRQSAVWVFQGEEKPTKFIGSRSVSKKMVAPFVSKAGHIAAIPLNEQRTVTADWYTTICQNSHTAQKTKQYLTEQNVELLDHPPYSPDLSPYDFITFPFQSPEEAWNKCFENCFAWNEIPQEDIDHLIRSMPRRVGECIAHQGASTHY
ncbi:unnamed protein product [Acanthoscelides obtectus]|uniref:Mos1 transposase HTH domain-containing protein n=1 Tax=Acanthoscelides obtectus TaxID=200917 RepID=A0A9P0LDJ0_ACAOB|nr:unnamed protein product [Acanthoscelides obtectus]CAK1637961.1 hypothetical protein AOBTE_LOCUS10314 [Acanthoscelides obtectus]